MKNYNFFFGKAGCPQLTHRTKQSLLIDDKSSGRERICILFGFHSITKVQFEALMYASVKHK